LRHHGWRQPSLLVLIPIALKIGTYPIPGPGGFYTLWVIGVETAKRLRHPGDCVYAGIIGGGFAEKRSNEYAWKRFGKACEAAEAEVGGPVSFCEAKWLRPARRYIIVGTIDWQEHL
jgi:hypothetical protein